MTLPPEIEAALEAWPERRRTQFVELMEDATSELQQELVQRAVLAGHTPGEVHAFADELRGLSDEQCFEACTLDADAPEGYSVTQLLRAESDPLFAFELKGGTLTPNEADDEPMPAPSPMRRREVMDAPEDRALAADPIRRAREHRQGFSADSGAFRPLVPSKSVAAVAPAPAMGPVPSAPTGLGGGHFFDDLLTEATRGLGVTWREHEVDAPGGISMEQALQQAVATLQRGVPVPCVIGNAQGKPLRFLLVLQTQLAGQSRAFQLYEPTSQELIWANEKDLLSKGELPFDNKALRRLVRVALPVSRGGSRAP